MSHLEDLVTQIQAEGEKLAKPGGTSRRPKLHGPPTAAALAKAVKRMPVSPPPSYHAFLSKHNGWEHFWSGFSIVGASGKHSKAALEDIQITVEAEVDSLAEASAPDRDERYTSKEESDPNFIYLPNHLIFATDFNGQIALFDRRTRDSEGEMQVLLWSHDGDVYRRYVNFISFLESVLSEIRAEIEKIKHPPARAQMDEATLAQRRALLQAIRSAGQETYQEFLEAQKKNSEDPDDQKKNSKDPDKE